MTYRYSLPVLLGDLGERMEHGGTTGQAEWEVSALEGGIEGKG